MSRESAAVNNQETRGKRLLIASNDLAESKSYIEAYDALANSLTYSDAYGALGEMVRIVENALLSYALISYARPFTESRGSQWTRLPNSYTSSFTREERRIHNYVLKARKKLIAHSDSEGIHTHAIPVNDGGLILSVRPVPIVMIQDEDDTLCLGSAAKRSGESAETTLEQILQIVRDVEPSSRPSMILLREERLFDIDSEHCTTLVGMIDKVADVIGAELSSARSKG